MSKVGIVTVLYNSQRVLKEFFESLNNQTYKDFTLYIIDNNSQDDSLRLARKLSQEVNFKCVIYPEKENWGVAKGNNIGIQAALKDKCEFILLSNNDIVLDHTDTLEILVKKMDESDIDILCPKIYYYYDPTIIWAAGGGFNKKFTSTVQYGLGSKDIGQFDYERRIDFTPTCFVIIRNSVFHKIGMMEEWYFVYYDDTDFMFRALTSGLKIYYFPTTSILHNESSSSGKDSPVRTYYLVRNQLYFVKKYRSAVIWLCLLAYRLSAVLLKHIWVRPTKNWKAELKGIRDGIKKTIFNN